MHTGHYRSKALGTHGAAWTFPLAACPCQGQLRGAASMWRCLPGQAREAGTQLVYGEGNTAGLCGDEPWPVLLVMLSSFPSLV